MKMEASVDPQCRGPDWMPITPKAGSLFHAETQVEVPYADEAARALLQMFARKNVRQNEILMASAVNIKFLKDSKYRAEDYVAGLSYAVEKGWLTNEGNMLRVTPAGFRELPSR